MQKLQQTEITENTKTESNLQNMTAEHNIRNKNAETKLQQKWKCRIGNTTAEATENENTAAENENTAAENVNTENTTAELKFKLQ